MTPPTAQRLIPAIRRRLTSTAARANARLARPLGALVAKRSGTSDLSSVVLLSVYRNRNAATLGEHVSLVHEHGGQVWLWCLDSEPVEAFARWTVGAGPGTRCELLNRAYARAEMEPGRSADVVITDDDVEMTTGSIAEFVAFSREAGLDLAQPGHDHRSYFTHPITARHPLSVARETHFVEIGPMLFISSAVRDEVLPMPEEYGMGWGLDFRWSHQFRDRRRMGVIDAVAMRHLGVVEGAYDLDGEARDRARRDHERAGEVTSGSAVATWRPWRGQPPWTVREPT